PDCYPPGARAGQYRRRRRHRRQGPRAGSGDRGPSAAVRRPRRGARDPPLSGGAGRVIPLDLDQIEELCPGTLDQAPWADAAAGVKIDSRRVEEGDLFVVVGDGAAFRRHAFARGAAATLVPEDAFAALAALGGAVRGRSRAEVVGITGSTGKT